MQRVAKIPKSSIRRDNTLKFIDRLPRLLSELKKLQIITNQRKKKQISYRF